MNEFDIRYVPTDLILDVWNSKIDMIRRGLKHTMGDTTSEQEMLESIQRGDQQLWTIVKGEEVQAVAVIAIHDFVDSKKVSINMIAGRNFKGWVGELETILLTLKDMVGADCIESACRLGSAKILADRGWHKKAIIMELR